MFQRLENRVLMSISLVEGQLTIVGTAQADQINISKRSGAEDVIVVELNDQKQEFHTGQIKFIIIDAAGGDDVVSVNAAPVGATVLGGNGDDLIGGSDFGHDLLVGGAGRDTLEALNSGDTLFGGRGNDDLRGRIDIGGPVEGPFTPSNIPCTQFGGAGDDLLQGGSGDDYLSGDEGNDTIEGHQGNDSLLGGAGNDQLSDTDGHDTLRGGPGNDLLDAFGHNDKFSRGGGIDVINTEPGHVARNVIID